MNDCNGAGIVYEDGTHTVTDEGNLERFTRDGWRLVRPLPCSAPISYVVKAAEYSSQSNGWTTTPEVRGEQIGTVLRFLLVKSRETEAAEFRLKIQDLEDCTRSLNAQIETLVKDSEKVADALAESEKQVERERSRADTNLRALNAALVEHRAALKESSVKLRCAEGQLATIRAALGDLQMKEILGAAIPF
jgi:predicted RNase H-like nuclease (RuvC/YqgF family)